MGIAEALIGVVGTLLGTILGWFLNSFSRRGKVGVFVVQWEQHLHKNEAGHMVCCRDKDDAESYS